MTATGGDTPTGSITFLDGDTPLATVALDGNGQASFTSPTMAAGDHSITAVYLGAPGFDNSASTTLIQVVNTGGATTTVTADHATTTTAPGGGTGSPELAETGRDENDTTLPGLLVTLLAAATVLASRRLGGHRLS